VAKRLRQWIKVKNRRKNNNSATKVNMVDIPVMLTPSPVILTPIRDDGLREL